METKQNKMPIVLVQCGCLPKEKAKVKIPAMVKVSYDFKFFKKKRKCSTKKKHIKQNKKTITFSSLPLSLAFYSITIHFTLVKAKVRGWEVRPVLVFCLYFSPSLEQRADQQPR